jgi:hypothetical protein
MKLRPVLLTLAFAPVLGARITLKCDFTSPTSRGEPLICP